MHDKRLTYNIPLFNLTSLYRAGSGAIPELQDATSAQVSGARDKFAANVQKTKRRVDGIWGQGKVGTIFSTIFCLQPEGYISRRQEQSPSPSLRIASKYSLNAHCSDVVQGMANDVIATVQGKADDAAKGAKRTLGQATSNNLASGVKGNAGNVASNVQSKVDEATAPAKSAGGGFFGKIAQQSKGARGAVAKAGAKIQSALPGQ